MIIGIDVSTFSIALGILEEHECVSAEIISKKKTFEERFDDLIPKFTRGLIKLNPDIVFIEEIPYVNNPSVVSKLNQIVGAVRGACAYTGTPHFIVNNRTWKKTIGAKGKKEEIKENVRIQLTKLYDITDNLTENQMDSLGVMTYGFREITGADSIGKYLEWEIRHTGTLQIEQSTEKITPEGTEQTGEKSMEAGSQRDA